MIFKKSKLEAENEVLKKENEALNAQLIAERQSLQLIRAELEEVKKATGDFNKRVNEAALDLVASQGVSPVKVWDTFAPKSQPKDRQSIIANSATEIKRERNTGYTIK